MNLFIPFAHNVQMLLINNFISEAIALRNNLYQLFVDLIVCTPLQGTDVLLSEHMGN